MRIVKRAEFLAMPEGTVYSHYTPCVTEGFHLKGEMCGNNDWWVVELEGVSVVNADNTGELVDTLTAMEERGLSAPSDYRTMARDGCYLPDGLFLIYEREDILKLITRLQEAIA